ncbi:MAG: hypothetical protein KDA41_21220, partial [Planctomycetales bacterium]|nr:hypothetical protein [Planctomycetales bacterium]
MGKAAQSCAGARRALLLAAALCGPLVAAEPLESRPTDIPSRLSPEDIREIYDSWWFHKNYAENHPDGDLAKARAEEIKRSRLTDDEFDAVIEFEEARRQSEVDAKAARKQRRTILVAVLCVLNTPVFYWLARLFLTGDDLKEIWLGMGDTGRVYPIRWGYVWAVSKVWFVFFACAGVVGLQYAVLAPW